ESPLDEEKEQQIQDLGKRLAEDEADQKLALRLEKVREDRSIWVEGSKFNYALAQREYTRVFQQAGYAMQPGHEEKTASRIQQSPIKEQLLAALDDWAWVVWLQPEKGLHQRLLRIGRQADPHPWKDQLRDPARWGNREALKALASNVLADKET